MSRLTKWIACGVLSLCVAALALSGAAYFVFRVHTVTIDNATSQDLQDVHVQVSGKTLWRGDIPARGGRWVLGTEPDAVISDRDRRILVSMTIDGRAVAHDFGYVTLAESHLLRVVSPEDLGPDTFRRCFF